MTDHLAPTCPRCRKRHLLDLPCWAGRYAQRVTAAVLATHGRVCWLCGKGGANTADHVIARSHCGTDTPSNLLPACGRCNASRQNRAPFPPDPEPRPAGVGLSPRWRTP